jgi:tellurite resistance protein TerC
MTRKSLLFHFNLGPVPTSYLKYGLSLVFMVVGAKMLSNAAFGKVIPTEVALLVTALLIGGSMLVSVINGLLPKVVAAKEAIRGWVPCSPEKPAKGEDLSVVKR